MKSLFYQSAKSKLNYIIHYIRFSCAISGFTIKLLLTEQCSYHFCDMYSYKQYILHMYLSLLQILITYVVLLCEHKFVFIIKSKYRRVFIEVDVSTEVGSTCIVHISITHIRNNNLGKGLKSFFSRAVYMLNVRVNLAP